MLLLSFFDSKTGLGMIRRIGMSLAVAAVLVPSTAWGQAKEHGQSHPPAESAANGEVSPELETFGRAVAMQARPDQVGYFREVLTGTDKALQLSRELQSMGAAAGNIAMVNGLSLQLRDDLDDVDHYNRRLQASFSKAQETGLKEPEQTVAQVVHDRGAERADGTAVDGAGRSCRSNWRPERPTWRRRFRTSGRTRSGWDGTWEYRQSDGDIVMRENELAMKRIFCWFSMLLVMLTVAIAANAQGSVGPVTFQVGTDMRKRVLSPGPGPGGTNQSKKALIGRGRAMMNTGDVKDPFWTETIDISGAGQVTSTDMLWDSSSKILYAFAQTTLRCTHGKTVDGNILIGIYGKKNFLEKPMGSGWWVVELEKDQCEAPQAGLYGCKFSPSGQTLACGRAEWIPASTTWQS